MSNTHGPAPQTQPPQTQSDHPGHEEEMHPKPQFEDPDYHGCGKLKDKVAIVTGGDSGIGRAVAISFAIEGADVVITCLDTERDDAAKTKQVVESKGRKCLVMVGDLCEEDFSHEVVKKTIAELKRLDIVVNNAAVQYRQTDFEKITKEQLEKTFKTNIFSYFYMSQAALPHLKEGSAIINTTSVTAYKGHDRLIDYASTKGAIVAFTRSLSQNLMSKKIRVNGVAPGPIWTPLIPSSFTAEEVKKFGTETPMKRAGQPKEVSPCYVFLASDDSSYMSGQVLHPNGGVIVNG
jgi:NAD(P)-dependent dehydrogenase (short-subunit alcohol dehydrogenase family)